MPTKEDHCSGGALTSPNYFNHGSMDNPNKPNEQFTHPQPLRTETRTPLITSQGSPNDVDWGGQNPTLNNPQTPKLDGDSINHFG